LNYTIKRLIGGICSDNAQIKRGFFLGAVSILKEFKQVIDVDKLIKYISAETKVSGGMKKSEIHSNEMARMLCLSALVESSLLIDSKKKQLSDVVEMLVTIYKQQEFLRESIQVIFDKVFRANSGSVKIFDYIVEKLLVEDCGEGSKLMDNVACSSSHLSLFLRLRRVNLDGVMDKRTVEYSELMDFNILQSAKHLTLL